MEEQDKIIMAFLNERGIDESTLTKRQMNDLRLVFNTVALMREILASNEINVKNVAERTKTKDGNGRSISLATFYNNEKLLYHFVDYLKPENTVGVRERLSDAEAEISELKEINSKLIRRDIKAEAMQAEIDALRLELKRMRDRQELKHTSAPEVTRCIIRSDKAKS